MVGHLAVASWVLSMVRVLLVQPCVADAGGEVIAAVPSGLTVGSLVWVVRRWVWLVVSMLRASWVMGNVGALWRPRGGWETGAMGGAGDGRVVEGDVVGEGVVGARAGGGAVCGVSGAAGEGIGSGDVGVLDGEGDVPPVLLVGLVRVGDIPRVHTTRIARKS